jgi:hypothetical protein
VTIPPRSVPLTYRELAAALQAGVFPRERSWIDFKRRLYPESAAGDGAARERVSLELAKDLASMAVLGGYLVYGVKEDKAKHLFEVDDMQLPVGLHETVDAVARDKITPPLNVVPTLVPSPETTSTGFLVVEVPQSPDAPHMADSIYWGRSETGKVRLADEQVERLMRARDRQSERLAEAMQGTARSDPLRMNDRGAGCHFYFTAVPATGWADMFAGYARDHASRMRLIQRCVDLQNAIRQTEPNRPDIAFAGLSGPRRTQQVAAGWLSTWDWPARDGRGRTVGVDDDGPIRYINLGAFGPSTPDRPVVRDLDLMYQTRDIIRLVAALADDVGYSGSWLLGVHLDKLSGHVSQVSSPYGFPADLGSWDDSDYSQTTRASAVEIRENPTLITDQLMRPLMRGLGTEAFLSQPPFSA